MMGDVATGEMHDFPYGGEEYYMLGLTYAVKGNMVHAQWLSGEKCIMDELEWTGTRFVSLNKREAGGRGSCEN